jgi:hypothetical protein
MSRDNLRRSRVIIQTLANHRADSLESFVRNHLSRVAQTQVTKWRGEHDTSETTFNKEDLLPLSARCAMGRALIMTRRFSIC